MGGCVAASNSAGVAPGCTLFECLSTLPTAGLGTLVLATSIAFLAADLLVFFGSLLILVVFFHFKKHQRWAGAGLETNLQEVKR